MWHLKFWKGQNVQLASCLAEEQWLRTPVLTLFFWRITQKRVEYDTSTVYGLSCKLNLCCRILRHTWTLTSWGCWARPGRNTKGRRSGLSGRAKNPSVSCYTAKTKVIIIIMSFCRILSTLCSQVVFHNLPQFSRGRQKSGIKSTV